MSVVTDYFISVDGNDLSQYLRTLDLPIDPEMVDDTTMSSTTTTRKNEAGLINWTVTATFKQVYNGVDSILFPLVRAAAFPIIMHPASGAVSASNPFFTGNAVISSYPPLGGSVGDHDETTVTFQCAGTLARAVA